MSAEVGTCDLCGQEMIRTPDDCWHPYSVAIACPPEPPGNSPEWGKWAQAGNHTGRPGRQHFKPATPETSPAPAAEPTYGMCTHCGAVEVALDKATGTRDLSDIGESAAYPTGYGCEVCS